VYRWIRSNFMTGSNLRVHQDSVVSLLPEMPEVVVQLLVSTTLCQTLGPSEIFELRMVNKAWQRAINDTDEWDVFQNLDKSDWRYICHLQKLEMFWNSLQS
jgi:hypothetical protein